MSWTVNAIIVLKLSSPFLVRFGFKFTSICGLLYLKEAVLCKYCVSEVVWIYFLSNTPFFTQKTDKTSKKHENGPKSVSFECNQPVTH